MIYPITFLLINVCSYWYSNNKIDHTFQIQNKRMNNIEQKLDDLNFRVHRLHLQLDNNTHPADNKI